MEDEIDMMLENPIVYLYMVPAILLSLSFHEFSHAFVAFKLGDPTARNLGRLTLNPLKHLDILGTIMLIVARFGWAKPVPVNPSYFNDRRKGTILVSVAGPLSNVVLAFISYIPMMYFRIYFSSFGSPLGIVSVIYNLSMWFYVININLAVFNILPVPPLDGSKILSGILPPRQYFKMVQYENYIAVVFLLLLFIWPGILSTIMSPFVWVINTAIEFLAGPIVKLLL